MYNRQHTIQHVARRATGSVRRVVMLFVTAILLLSSCNKDDPEPSVASPVDKAVLVYSIGTNSMEYYLNEDIEEMKIGLKRFHESQGAKADNYRWMMYICNYTGAPRLVELVYSDGTVSEKVISQYDETVSSCTQSRMSEVLRHFLTYANASSYGLVLASHGGGWDDGTPVQKSASDRFSDNKFWFGQDGDRADAKMNIDALAAAIPDNTFDYIWTDCCFMGNIETAYELRNDCRLYIGSPTELMATGSPYIQVVEPMLKGDVVTAARLLIEDYKSKGGTSGSATIGVYDMTQIQPVMRAARALLLNYAEVTTHGLQQYHRSVKWPAYYDFTNYIRRQAEVQNRPDLLEIFEQAMDNFVVYKDATTYFLGLYINPEKYSGVSVHVFTDNDSDRDNFYKTLNWYRDVYVR